MDTPGDIKEHERFMREAIAMVSSEVSSTIRSVIVLI
jgi:hypothetical protein